MIKSINHIGIAVKNLDESIALYGKIFNIENIHREIIASQKVEIASFKVGDVSLELTAPTDDDSPIARFLNKNGEGIHHIAFDTDNVQDELDRLSGSSISLVDTQPRPGAHDLLIAFLHPKSTGNVLIELCRKK